MALVLIAIISFGFLFPPAFLDYQVLEELETISRTVSSEAADPCDQGILLKERGKIAGLTNPVVSVLKIQALERIPSSFLEISCWNSKPFILRS
jgi:hypothetical protein